jgi:signal transduction histidine kinase/CheY-like chemotaxis protein
MNSRTSEAETRLLLMPLGREQDVVLCRNRARSIAAALNFDRQQQVRIATAVSEIARNAFRYAREATAEFLVNRGKPGGGPQIAPSFVTIVRDQGPGIDDLASILAGTYQSANGMGLGILGAKRLIDNVDINTTTRGTTVRLEQTLPKALNFESLNLQSVLAHTNRLSKRQLLDELGSQDQALITTLDQLNRQSTELDKMNEELDETNRGVVALYDEIDTVQRVGQVVASKLELGLLLQAITDATVEISAAECGGFFRKNSQDGTFTRQAVSGILGIALEKCILTDAAELFGFGENKSVFRINDLNSESFPSPLSPHLPIRSFLAVAVRDSGGAIIGALVFAHRAPGVFTERTERILSVVSVQLSIGLENARLYRAAQAASAAKDQFLAILSHELRTPLTPIFAILNEMEHYADLPAHAVSDLQVIRRNLQLETRLIDDLLDLTLISTGKLSLQREITDVHALIQSVVELCQEEISKQQISFELRLEAPRFHVLADAGRLQQALWNLLRNAIKFSDLGGKIELRTFTASNTELGIRIIDHGRGISLESLEKIFEPFVQGDTSVHRKFGGLGLGLSICKSVVDAHEGRIWAESPGPGKGATFVICLPLAEIPEPSNDSAPTTSAAAPTKSVRILLVDDHEDTLTFLSYALTHCGHEVVSASSCYEALNIARQQQFDVLISDLALRDGSGYELMSALQAMSSAKGIALSGFGMKEDIDRSMAAGFSVHVVKPCSLAALNAAIEKALS